VLLGVLLVLAIGSPSLQLSLPLKIILIFLVVLSPIFAIISIVFYFKKEKSKSGIVQSIIILILYMLFILQGIISYLTN